LSDISKKSIVEALIFAAANPLPQTKLVSIANLDSKAELEKIVESLNEEYEKQGRAFRIKPIAGGFQFFTVKAFAPYLREIFAAKSANRLSRQMLEVLGVIALKQPVTKPVIDKIRGSDSSGQVHSLLEQGFITIKGREKGPGRPFYYGTTLEFLRFFGLEKIEDLPNEQELAGLFADADEARAKLEIREIENETSPKSEDEPE